jgi:ribosomal protein S18 acetylase RimI-like enzyme
MVILSSEEFRAQENNRNQMGIERLTNKINLQSTRGFGHDGMNPTVETSLNNNEYIGYLMINDVIAASGFGKIDSPGGESNKYKTMYLHSISVAEEFRGQGLCKQITDEFIKKFGKNHILYLTVRTEAGNENTSGIKCYEKNGFIMLPQVYRDHYDGKNNAMIRLPTNSKNSIRSRRRRKKSRNKRK